MKVSPTKPKARGGRIGYGNATKVQKLNLSDESPQSLLDSSDEPSIPTTPSGDSLLDSSDEPSIPTPPSGDSLLDSSGEPFVPTPPSGDASHEKPSEHQPPSYSDPNSLSVQSEHLMHPTLIGDSSLGMPSASTDIGMSSYGSFENLTCCGFTGTSVDLTFNMEIFHKNKLTYESDDDAVDDLFLGKLFKLDYK